MNRLSASLFTLLIAASSGAGAATLLSPGDNVFGGQVIGGAFEVGVAGTTQPANNWPAGEPPTAAIDGFGQKYLNFGELNTGIVVTPGVGPTFLNGIQLWTANDSEPRDPASFELYGTNSLLSGTSFSLANFTLIAAGALSLPSSRNAGGTNALLESNSQTVNFTDSATGYESYMIIFPTVKDEANANSMQIAEIQLHGTVVPEPSAVSLLLCGLTGLLIRRRR